VVKAGQKVAGPVASRFRMMDRKLSERLAPRSLSNDVDVLVCAGIGDESVNHEVSIERMSIVVISCVLKERTHGLGRVVRRSYASC
jgi:hypothetical protein